MTDVMPGRRERKKEETKRRIYDAATKLFADKGFDATTIDDIAAAADVSKGTFFNYFPKKEAIIRYLFDEWTEIAEGIAHDRSRSAEDRMIQLFVSGAASFGENPKLARTVARYVLHELITPAPEMVETHKHQHALFDAVWIQGVEAGEFRADIDLVWARAVFGSMYVGALSWWVGAADCEARPDPMNLPLTDVIRTTMRMVLDGLRARKEA